MDTTKPNSELSQIADRIAEEIRAAAAAGGVGRVQTGRVWTKGAHIRVYVTQGARDIGWIGVDQDGAIDCSELRYSEKIGPHLETLGSALGVQVYGY